MKTRGKSDKENGGFFYIIKIGLYTNFLKRDRQAQMRSTEWPV